MGFKVTLISYDPALANLCRTTLGEFFGQEFTLTIGLVRDTAVHADLCIWDFIADQTEVLLEPADRERLQNHLFIVHRKDLRALRQAAGSPNLNVLLKPLTSATLGAFLGEACRRWGERDQDFAARRLRVERDEMLQCLIQANLRLQEYDQDRTTFLARSLHDLRSPLTAISGYCGLLLGEELGPLSAEQQEVLQRIQYSIRRLSRMANAMFQLSISNRIEQKLVLQAADIRECIDRAVEEQTPFLDEKRISVSVDVEPADLLSFDKAQVEQMVINLLDNACKFTPRGGTIDIKGYPYFWDRRIGQPARLDRSLDRRIEQVNTPNSFRIDILDSGPGIPLARLSTIFEEFTSYSGGQDRSGGGLGLAICRMIVRRHEGRLWAENGASGAVFSFVLPYRRGAATAADGGALDKVGYKVGA